MTPEFGVYATSSWMVTKLGLLVLPMCGGSNVRFFSGQLIFFFFVSQIRPLFFSDIISTNLIDVKNGSSNTDLFILILI